MKIFDAHSDIWTDVTVQRLRGGGDVLNRRHMDRLGKGGVEGSIFVIWVDPPFDADPMARTRDIMDAIRAEMGESGAVTVVHSFDEMMAAREAGRFYVFIGIEGLAAIGEDLDLIDWYYDFGCRHAGLTWNEQNALATLKIADYAYVLELGSISMSGPAAELIHDQRLIDAYLGGKKA